jgi:glutamate-5-semialdehyde dehydrogenase
MNLKTIIEKQAQQAREASRVLSKSSTRTKNNAILLMSKYIKSRAAFILEENKKDIRKAVRSRLSKSMVDRLTLDKKRIYDMSDSMKAVSRLPDPCGIIDKMWKRPNGLVIGKMRIPIGVIAIIYESRPNVTSDCAGLCIKSGNSVILKGGKESIHSNIAIFKTLQIALKESGLPSGCINMVASIDRKAVSCLLAMDRYVDLVIPRGGEGLIKTISDESRIPVIKHYKGVCHIYIDRQADLDKALRICLNAKTQRPGVCNAMETLLVHKDIAKNFMPKAIKSLQKKGVEIRGCGKTIGFSKNIKRADEKDWYEEYLDLVLSVRIVKDINQAIEHIDKYGSGHSEAIVTENHNTAVKFLKEVDSACVYSNASTRFTDGYQFGLGAEIGISTDRIHARGPMALEELTIYKYVIFGTGQVRR